MWPYLAAGWWQTQSGWCHAGAGWVPTNVTTILKKQEFRECSTERKGRKTHKGSRELQSSPATEGEETWASCSSKNPGANPPWAHAYSLQNFKTQRFCCLRHSLSACVAAKTHAASWPKNLESRVQASSDLVSATISSQETESQTMNAYPLLSKQKMKRLLNAQVILTDSYIDLTTFKVRQ